MWTVSKTCKECRGKTNLNFSESESFRILLPNPNPNPNLTTPSKIYLDHLSTLVIVQIIINMVVI